MAKLLRDIDSRWDDLGQSDPYWAVLSDDAYHSDNLTESARRDFFASGDAHVELVLGTIRQHLDPAFAPANAVDFGCGVGRLVIPFARRGSRVVGVDVAPSMLREAERQSAQAGVSAAFVLSDDRLSRVAGSFDLVHTFIVLQHINPRRGMPILARLLELVAPGGVAALHVTYFIPSRPPKRLLRWVRLQVPGMAALSNVIQRRPRNTPHIPMYEYDLAKVFRMIAGVTNEVHVRHTDHDGRLGAFIFCRRPEARA